MIGNLEDVIKFVKNHTDFSFVLEDYGICLGNVKDYDALLQAIYESSSQRAEEDASKNAETADIPKSNIVCN